MMIISVNFLLFAGLVEIIEDDDWWAADYYDDFIGSRVDNLPNGILVYLCRLRHISRHINN